MCNRSSPSAASVAKGRQLFDWMVDDLAALIRKGQREQPPLTCSYFERAGESGAD